MKDHKFLLNILLTGLLTLALLAALLSRTFLPWLCLPPLNIPLMAAFSLAALVLEDWLSPAARRCWPLLFLLSAASFSLLPWAAGYVPLSQIGLLALVGGLVFGALTALFTFACRRLRSGKSGKAASLMTALCLFLACQGLSGMIL